MCFAFIQSKSKRQRAGRMDSAGTLLRNYDPRMVERVMDAYPRYSKNVDLRPATFLASTQA